MRRACCGAPFEPLPSVTDIHVHLDRAVVFPPPGQSTHHAESRSRRPVEAPCESGVSNDAIDRGRRPFWNHVRRENRAEEAAAPLPSSSSCPSSCGADVSPARSSAAEPRCDHHTYRVHGKVGNHEACNLQRSPQATDSPRAPHQHGRHPQDSRTPQHDAPAKSVLEITIERVIVSGRLIDLVI